MTHKALNWKLDGVEKQEWRNREGLEGMIERLYSKLKTDKKTIERRERVFRGYKKGQDKKRGTAET